MAKYPILNVRLGPGTEVLNQGEPSMCGTVIPTPEDCSDPDDTIWVEWGNGLICQEYHSDVIPTGNLYLEILP